MIKVNEKFIDYTLFPNKEMLVDTSALECALCDLKDNDSCRVEYQFDGNESLLFLYFVLRHIKYEYVLKIDLNISYMPYSRMDRSQNGSCFTLFHIVQLISSILDPCDTISIVEPHSWETIKQFRLAHSTFTDNVKSVSVIPMLAQKVMNLHPEINVVCYPDKGARERYADAAFDKPIVYCEKKRDFDTGNIIGLDLITDQDLTGKSVLIVDDLCSKGGTFFHTANKLREAGASAVFLVVCHMEENVLKGELVKATSPINQVYCTNTMAGTEKIHQDKITVFDWRPLACTASM